MAKLKNENFISHRSSSVSSTDRIIVIGNGSIIARDKHENLMKSCKKYCEMYGI